MFFLRTGIDIDDLEFNTRKLKLEDDEEYKKLLVEYNQKMENLSKQSWKFRVTMTNYCRLKLLAKSICMRSKIWTNESFKIKE